MAKILPADIDTEAVHPMFRDFATQVKKALTDFAHHLLNLSPLDNFSGFVYEGTIAAGVEVKIINRAKKVPMGRLVILCKGGQVEDGPTAWSKDFVYLKNAGASSITVKVFFFV